MNSLYALKHLPVSKSDITVLLSNNMLYIDKTQFAYDMIAIPGCYFLSRPRRFGKSMLLSTFEQVFLGNKQLFKEQWIYNSPWQWQEHPVIRLDFNVESDIDLRQYIKQILRLVAVKYNIFNADDYKDMSYGMYFRELILLLQAKYNRNVVVLIDEYDKPILDVLNNVTLAEERHEILKGFYTVMKGVDEQLHFVFLTGVSRFSKVGIFSGLNNLKDISMDDKYATICGITQEELEHYCKDHIQALATKHNMDYAACIKHIRDWYNGFCFSRRGESVYNPFSTMNVLVDQEFGNYWFSSGNASAVIKLMKQQPDLEMFQFDKYTAKSSDFDTFEIENINITAFLFQAGYLTIKGYDPDTQEYTLSYPNREINESFKNNVLGTWSRTQGVVNNKLITLSHALLANNLEVVMENLRLIFLNIDYDIELSKENNYQSIFYLIFQLLGFNIQVEYKTAKGRIDAIMHTKNNIYIFEFKLNKSAQEALAQIEDRSYYARFLNTPLAKGEDENLANAADTANAYKTIYLIGANFNSQERTIDDYIVKTLLLTPMQR